MAYTYTRSCDHCGAVERHLERSIHAEWGIVSVNRVSYDVCPVCLATVLKMFTSPSTEKENSDEPK